MHCTVNRSLIIIALLQSIMHILLLLLRAPKDIPSRRLHVRREV